MNDITPALVLIVIATVFLGVCLFHPELLEFTEPYYAPLGYADYTGAPDGIYEQLDWGSPLGLDIPWGSETVVYGGWYSNVTDWNFAMCDHDYLGPLHGCWPVANGTSIPVWQVGVFPVDARLYVTIENNTIVKAEVKSSLVYGN
jgi:hypothetical protein